MIYSQQLSYVSCIIYSVLIILVMLYITFLVLIYLLTGSVFLLTVFIPKQTTDLNFFSLLTHFAKALFPPKCTLFVLIISKLNFFC